MKVVFTSLILLLVLTCSFANSFYANILFDHESDELTTSASNRIEQLATELNENELRSNSEKIVITGFTDQSSSESEDSLLARNRSKAVAQRIHDLTGIPKELIIVRGEAQNRYHILTVTAEGRRQNRRAEIVIRKFTRRRVPLSLNAVEHSNVRFSSDSISIFTEGDTITVDSLGYCRLLLGTRITIDVDENSQLTINDDKIVLLKGAIQQSRTGTDERIPTFAAGENTFKFNGNGAVELTSSNVLLVSVFSESAQVRSPFGNRTGNAMEGVAVEPDSNRITVTTLPTAPTVQINDTLLIVSGAQDSLKWNRTGETFALRFGTTSSFTEVSTDTVLSDTLFMINSTPGEFYVQLQAFTAPGFISLWSEPKKIVVDKAPSIISITPFDDTLFVVSPSRPFTVSGVAEPITSLFLNEERIELGENGEFIHTLMLNDDVTELPFVSVNPDSSRDTLATKVLYTGADEIIYVNDTILGRPAYTTTRYYNFRGTMPTATALTINGVETLLDDQRYFSTQYKFPGYDTTKLEIEISFENGHTKTINRSIERIKNETEAQRTLFTILGIVAVSGLFVLIATQTGE